MSCQFLTYNAMYDFDLVEALNPVDCGDCDIALANPQRTFERAQADIGQILAAGALPVTLGGDHSITIPAVRAVRAHHANPGLVLIDTHLDTAPDVGGEELNHCCPITRAVDAGFDPEHIALVGISGWMNPRTELAYCRERGITVIWLEEIWERGTRWAAERALEVAAGGTDGVYLSFDVDSLDAALARGHLLPDARRPHEPRGDRARARRGGRRAARRGRRRGRAEPGGHSGHVADGRAHRRRGDGPSRGRRAVAVLALLAQLAPAPRDVDANAARVVRALRERPEADLAVFPELFLGGYTIGRLDELALAPDAAPLRAIAQAAAATRTAVVVGFAERLADGVANAVACFGGDGTLEGVYRKTHLFGAESRAFTPGDEQVVVPLAGALVAPLICFDIEFPEPARAVARAGAGLLVTASANMAPVLGRPRAGEPGPRARQPPGPRLREPRRLRVGASLRRREPGRRARRGGAHRGLRGPRGAARGGRRPRRRDRRSGLPAARPRRAPGAARSSLGVTTRRSRARDVAGGRVSLSSAGLVDCMPRRPGPGCGHQDLELVAASRSRPRSLRHRTRNGPLYLRPGRACAPPSASSPT